MKKAIAIITFFAMCGIKNEIMGLVVLSLLSIAGLFLLLRESERHGE